MTDPSVASFKSARLEQQGIEMQPRSMAGGQSAALGSMQQALAGETRSHQANLRSRQDALMSQLVGMGARELGRVQLAHNAVAVKVDAASLSAISQLPGVAQVRPVINYKLDLSETVPYVGAAAAQAAGKDGKGVRVAVLDSGIDYTHRNLGGKGTTAAYAAAYGADPSDPKNTRRNGLFPTAKVVGGFDFVGETWGVSNGEEFGERTEDPDPIDFQGHGTHVADIVAGRSTDGKHKGVAPGASLVAIKVCSAVSSACNGVALLKGADHALDPNGDGDLGDAVDVMNLSLGGDYGQKEDDLSLALNNAVRLGVVVVASAGNGSNRPYVVGSPSTASGVLSVAQTEVPSALGYVLTVSSPASIAGAYGNVATIDWAPLGAGVSGTVAVVGQGCPASGSIPADPYMANPAGKIALIDRGECNISAKVDRAARAGATGVLIGLIAPGDAVSFSQGEGSVFVPTMVVQQVLSEAIKANKAAPVKVSLPSQSNGVPLVGGMASTSSRGPSMSFSSIKPEIGAPGASVSAVAGSGNGEEGFGGKSGAAPMVAGAAAILVQAFPERSPAQVKALLMNSAETKVYTSNTISPGLLAPITRIGAGELRVDRALALGSVARERMSQSAALSFGFHKVTANTVLEKTLLIENFGNVDKQYTIATSFRYASDAANGAIKISVPNKVSVRARGKEEVKVKLTIDGRKLPAWGLNGGPLGGEGALLEGNEFDGYLTLTAGSEKLSVPWHVLPRKSALMSVNDNAVDVGQKLKLSNAGIEVGDFDVFSLTGVSRKTAPGNLPQPGDNFAFIDLRAVGVRLADAETTQFAVNTFGHRAHPNYPAQFQVGIDANRDGALDYVVFNNELGGFGASGSNAVYVFDPATGISTAYYYTDGDLQSGSVILTVPNFAIGVAPGQKIDFAVIAVDNYFTDLATDGLGTMTYTLGKPKFVATGVPPTGVAPKSSIMLGTAAVPGGAAASPSQQGLLLMNRLDAGQEALIVRVK